VAAARRGLAHLHGHGQQPDPHLREQGRGAALLPALSAPGSGLNGLCKLPWNDVEPADNSQDREPAKGRSTCRTTATWSTGITGRKITKEQIIEESKSVYTFQRVFDLARMGARACACTTCHPYRSVGPVTKEEYESRPSELRQAAQGPDGRGPGGEDRRGEDGLHRKWREDRYQKLCDAVYKRRGWTPNGVPTLETLQKYRGDFPEVVEVVPQAPLSGEPHH
jgi:aldehyde:ferredoxin oxidoreductase